MKQEKEKNDKNKRTDEDGLKCPNCGSRHVNRILDDISRKRNIEVFKCGSCEKKFYKRNVEDFRPTY